VLIEQRVDPIPVAAVGIIDHTLCEYNGSSTYMSETNLRVLITAEQIQSRIVELGEKISKDYPTGNLHMICILKGAVYFMTDLTRALKRDVLVDFMGISTYGRGKTSSGEVRVTKDLDISLEGADVLIVEDIVDSGITLNYLMHVLDQRKPRSIRIAALLDKPERRLRPVHVSYVGFEIPDEFVVGYGLDYAEKYRNLRDICVLEEPGKPASA
jgi:hypoxanthine phosphoribosyltransferase